MTFRKSLPRLIVFLTLSGVFAAYLVIVLGEARFSATHTYTALFKNVSHLKSGDPVRVGGVEVGKVKSVRIADGRLIEVRFDADTTVVLTTATRATVRYKNLIGDRFLELSQGDGPVVQLRSGGTIPLAHTTPALNLDTLLNGFKPLFVGLDTTQINELSSEIVNVLQGQSASIYSLLSSVGSLTATLGRNDKLISDVIVNLNTALGTLDDRSTAVSDLITELQTLVSGLNKDKDPIALALVHLDEVAGRAADLLATVRPTLRSDVTALDALATNLNRNADTLQSVLTKLPKAYERLARAGSYGGFFNFYMCALRFKLDGPGGKPVYTPYTYSDAARCQ